MATSEEVKIEMRLNTEGHWSRETYRATCAARGVAYAEADYLRWRDVGERLSGQLSFETTVRRTTEAFGRLGLSLDEAARALADYLRDR